MKFRNILLASVLLLPIALIVVVVIVLDGMNPQLMTLIVAPFVALSMWGGTQIYVHYEGWLAARHKGECMYYIEDKVFEIKKRNAYVADKLAIVPEMRFSVGYNPAQLTYTGVTIGAATVGNFSVQDEFASMKPQPTGYYYLKFKSDKEYRVERILLTDDLVIRAEINPFISQYLVGNELVLWDLNKTVTNTEKSTAEYLMGQGDLQSQTKAMNIVSQGMTGAILSQKDCRKIQKWLAGKNFL